MNAPADLPASDPLQLFSTPDLESELLTLAGHLAAAQYRFLELLAEYDRRDGWAGPGLRSCAHWLSWRIGMSLRTAREHVRVAHALARLPAIRTSFAAGKISYSKVRAITRLVDGMAPPPSEQGDSAESADEAHAVGPHTDEQQETETTEAPTPAATKLAADAEQTLLGIALNGTASHVESVVRATRRRQADPRRPAALRGVTWRWAEDGSLILHGRFTPTDGTALIAAIEALTPPLQPVSHADPPAPDDCDEQAAEQEPGAVVDRIAARRADALVRLATRPDGGTRASAGDGAPATVILHLETGAQPRAELLGGPEIPSSTAERLSCDAHVQALLDDRESNRLYLGRRHRLATPAQIAALTVRDGRCCQFPGCTNSRYLHAHHVQHWLHGGRTDLENLLLICTFHHTLIHEGGYRIRRAEHDWEFQRPDGRPIPLVPEPLTGRAERLAESSTRASISISRDSLTPNWGGERLDLESVLDRLLPQPTRMAA